MILESERFALKRLSAAIRDLSTHFKIKRMTVGATGNEPTDHGDLDSKTGRSDARLQRLQHEVRNAIRSALSADADWQIHLRNHHYDSTNDKTANDSVSLSRLVGDPAD